MWLTSGSPPALRRVMRVVTGRRLTLLALAVFSSRGAAQEAAPPSPPISCDGRIVTRIEITPGRPPFQGSAAKWRAAARAVGLHHATTQQSVIESFMALHVGRP